MPPRLRCVRTIDEWIAAATRRDDGCLIWAGYIEKNGYGRINQRDVPERWAHRAVYTHVIGPIPVQHELDHLCHSRAWQCPGGDRCVHRACVEPTHLEPVTPYENWARGRSWCAMAQGRPVCKDGHDLSGYNFARVSTTGKFYCRQCNREKHRRQRVA